MMVLQHSPADMAGIQAAMQQERQAAKRERLTVEGGACRCEVCRKREQEPVPMMLPPVATIEDLLYEGRL